MGLFKSCSMYNTDDVDGSEIIAELADLQSEFLGIHHEPEEEYDPYLIPPFMQNCKQVTHYQVPPQKKTSCARNTCQDPARSDTVPEVLEGIGRSKRRLTF